MEIFRVSHDVYGQGVLEGLNWDLLWAFAGAGAAIIVIHLFASAFRKK